MSEFINGDQLLLDGITVGLNSSGEITVLQIGEDLQAVTDQGNTTTNKINVQGAGAGGGRINMSDNHDSLGAGRLEWHSQVFMEFDSQGDGVLLMQTGSLNRPINLRAGVSGSNGTLALGPNYWALSGGGNSSRLKAADGVSGPPGFTFTKTSPAASMDFSVPDPLTANRTWELPDSGISELHVSEGVWKLASSTDAAASNNTLYYSTDQAAPVYKDPGGTVNILN